ncbi:hypothetical protein [Kosakonia sacchari]|uniref:hypothetical protein n=1 Tax=Kosakonia sacchari TaxID=1158459 RepID=UPI0015774408|nr:hypothetical protein [Kosakonia sacchari]
MKEKIMMAFIVISSLILCSCEKNDKDCLSTPDNKLDAHRYDKCMLRSKNNPSPKREW